MRNGSAIIDRAIAYEGLARFSCYAMSCSAMAFPKATWQAVGGFDESIPWHGLEDRALGRALGAAGWAIYAHTPGELRVSLEPSLYAGGVGNRRGRIPTFSSVPSG